MTSEPIVITGTLSADDHKRHIPLTFEVPPGTTRIAATFTTTPERSTGALFDNMVCLTVSGPDGPRGARHNNPVRDFAIDAAAATPGYTPGAIEPGLWTVWLDVFRLLGPDPVTYRLAVTLSDGPVATPAPPERPAPGRRGAGWYRGDLHAHTLHSDATWDVADLAAHARARRLDFQTLTDHNTVSGLAEMDGLSGDGLLTMGGVELTTHFGHALTLGTRRWQEWRARSLPGVTMPALAAAAAAEGRLFVIAHPMSPGDPACTGCRWEYDDMTPGNAPAVEIWNGPWSDYNEDGLAAFHAWLNRLWNGEGRRLVATAGSDIHGPHESAAAFGFNHVYAEELGEPEILAAIARGHNYLSSGPELVIEATAADGSVTPMGGVAEAPAMSLAARWSGLAGEAVLRLVRNGDVIASEAVEGDGVRDLGLGEPGQAWYMAELRDPAGVLLAVTNPVFRGRSADAA